MRSSWSYSDRHRTARAILHGIELANAASRRIREALKLPIKIDQREVFATASVGVALSAPGQHSPGDLVRNADVAMYRAKANGRAQSIGFVGRLGAEHSDTAIVEAIIALARGLNMEVTAEGIETNAQRTRLTALGCHRGQGYYFARPLPPDAATELLTAQ